MKAVVKELKRERRRLARELAMADRMLAKLGGGIVRRRRRRKAVKAKPKAKAKAPAKKKAPTPTPEDVRERKRQKQEALRNKGAETAGAA